MVDLIRRKGVVKAPTLDEIIQLGAVDHKVFCLGFFPSTFRQEFPAFSNRLWSNLESDQARFVNAQMARGFAKTTNTRAYIAKRISYGISRSILLISKSSGHSEMSIGWIKRKIEVPTDWSKAFGLTKGAIWRNNELQIDHTQFGHSVHIIGMGIEGPIRGLNFDDWRPDLIVIDDAISDESAATDEQRNKVEDLILGALVNSLAPETDVAGSKMVMLQTPFSQDDASMKACKDPNWTTIRQGCWTLDSENLPLEQQISVWPERFTSESLRKQKLGAIGRNKLSIFTREMEVKLITPESSAFKMEWLQHYNSSDLTTEGMHCVIAIDPVPPPSELAIAKGSKENDYEAIAVVGYKNGNFYLLDYEFNRGHDPSWTLATLFSLIYRWRPSRIRVESVAYQRTLSWLIKQGMRRNRCFVPVEEVTDRRKKQTRIRDSIQNIASHKALFIDPTRHGHFVTQFSEFPYTAHDDIIDAVSMAVDGLNTVEANAAFENNDGNYDDLEIEYGAP